jgi:hypothetical protein
VAIGAHRNTCAHRETSPVLQSLFPVVISAAQDSPISCGRQRRASRVCWPRSNVPRLLHQGPLHPASLPDLYPPRAPCLVRALCRLELGLWLRSLAQRNALLPRYATACSFPASAQLPSKQQTVMPQEAASTCSPVVSDSGPCPKWNGLRMKKLEPRVRRCNLQSGLGPPPASAQSPSSRDKPG